MHIHVIKLDLYTVEIIIGNLMLDVLFQKEVLGLSHLWRDRIEILYSCHNGVNDSITSSGAASHFGRDKMYSMLSQVS